MNSSVSLARPVGRFQVVQVLGEIASADRKPWSVPQWGVAVDVLDAFDTRGAAKAFSAGFNCSAVATGDAGCWAVVVEGPLKSGDTIVGGLVVSDDRQLQAA